MNKPRVHQRSEIRSSAFSDYVARNLTGSLELKAVSANEHSGNFEDGEMTLWSLGARCTDHLNVPD